MPRKKANKAPAGKPVKKAIGRENIEKYGGRFLAILIVVFLFFLIILFMQVISKDRISSYMVRKGSLTQDNIYRAMLLKDEYVINAPASGTLICLAPEGEHAGRGSRLFSVDETGSLMGDASSGDYSPSEEDRELLKNEIDTFRAGFSPDEFRETYDFVHSLSSEINRISARSINDRIDSVNGLATISNDGDGGYVIYSADGMEGITVNDLKKSFFSESSYEKKQYMTGDLVDRGTPVCKLIRSDDWKAVIITDNEQAEYFRKEGYCTILFKDRDIRLSGKVSVSSCDADNSYCIFSFNSSVPNFASERFTDIEVKGSATEGLKIPVNAIADKTFFTIPKEFAVPDTAEEGGNAVFLKQSYLETGESSVLKVEVSVYSETADHYYVDNTQLKYGDVLIKPDSNAKYVVRDTDVLRGVYNINKGFARFYKVNILDENSEYVIIASDTTYGIREYDYIILDAENAVDDEFIYE
jgi:hypothetical protein